MGVGVWFRERHRTEKGRMGRWKWRLTRWLGRVRGRGSGPRKTVSLTWKDLCALTPLVVVLGPPSDGSKTTRTDPSEPVKRIEKTQRNKRNKH